MEPVRATALSREGSGNFELKDAVSTVIEAPMGEIESVAPMTEDIDMKELMSGLLGGPAPPPLVQPLPVAASGVLPIAMPMPPQPSGHSERAQSKPAQPSSHRHVLLASHEPWPLHPLLQVEVAQSAPSQPG